MRAALLAMLLLAAVEQGACGAKLMLPLLLLLLLLVVGWPMLTQLPALAMRSALRSSASMSSKPSSVCALSAATFLPFLFSLFFGILRGAMVSRNRTKSCLIRLHSGNNASDGLCFLNDWTKEGTKMSRGNEQLKGTIERYVAHEAADCGACGKNIVQRHFKALSLYKWGIFRL
jgi:hypothetical protein